MGGNNRGEGGGSGGGGGGGGGDGTCALTKIDFMIKPSPSFVHPRDVCE